jgi:vesicle coat complex subunit
MQVRWLLIASVLALVAVVLMVYWRAGQRVMPPTSPLASEADYLQKREKLRPLQMVKGTRPFKPEEMQLLRQAVRDMTDFRLRCRALTALAYVRDPQQRQEAIQLAQGRLKDPEGVVRQYALWALGNLGAKEAISSVLPLLQDPDQRVRQQARKTLQQLGYKVGE